jgi:hypothetical protein
MTLTITSYDTYSFFHLISMNSDSLLKNFPPIDNPYKLCLGKGYKNSFNNAMQLLALIL